MALELFYYGFAISELLLEHVKVFDKTGFHEVPDSNSNLEKPDSRGELLSGFSKFETLCAPIWNKTARNLRFGKMLRHCRKDSICAKKFY